MTDTYKMIKDLENKLKFTRDQVTRGLIVAEIEKIRMNAKTNTPVAELKKIIATPAAKADEVNKNGTSISKEVLEKALEDTQEHIRGIVFSNSPTITETKEDFVLFNGEVNGEVFEEESSEDNNNNNSNNHNNKKKKH